jgi:peptidoglycan/LPS O-acetylase OafA/YrhL
MAKNRRILQLDVLRGVAILLVLGRHPVVSPRSAGWLTPLAGLWSRIGGSGVDLFFVLSGFLVGGLLLSELKSRGRMDIGRFMIRRGLKIWPLYYLYLAFVLAVSHGGRFLWSSVLNVQNYDRLCPRQHLWSLAVEEHFYLLLPLLLWLLRRQRAGRWIPLVLMSMIVVVATARCAINWGRPFAFVTHVFPTHLRIDGLLLGALLAWAYHFRPMIFDAIGRHRNAIFFLGLGLIAPMAVLKLEDTPFVYTFGFTLLYLGYGCILAALVKTPVGEGWMGRFLEWRIAKVLAFVGVFSYPIYLFHKDTAQYLLEPLARTLLGAAAEHSWLILFEPGPQYFVLTGLYVILAIAVGYAVGASIERPTLMLRDRLFPRRAQAMLPASGLDAGSWRGAVPQSAA